MSRDSPGGDASAHVERARVAVARCDTSRVPDEDFAFNGVDARTGGYLLPAMPALDVAALARRAGGQDLGPLRRAVRGVKDHVDPRSLAESGWAVLMAHDAEPGLREALRPLLAHRAAEAGRIDPRRYREFAGPTGVRPGESKRALLERLGAAPSGAVSPDRLPYYLLLVGGPDAVPFELQALLDVQYAVGRIHFDSLEEYARYAQSVVAAETAPPRRAARLTLFGTRHPDDPATALSSAQLLGGLADSLVLRRSGWTLDTNIGEAATKERLARLFSGPDAPALLFTATHGVGFPCGDPQQRARQGALLCQQWPGPAQWREPLPASFYYSADDLADTDDVRGLIACFFACYGGGTPAFDATEHHEAGGKRRIAPAPFVAGLPRRLLAHPRGGALAVVAHVDRAWSCSFRSRVGPEVDTHASVLERLLDGHPIGSALEPFGARHAELAADLATELDVAARDGLSTSLASLWTATNDARNFLLLGDPAVRLPG